MRFGLISDIHGNLPALEAALEQLEDANVDRLVCLGDMAVGPLAHETMARLREADPVCVVGNWDAWLLDGVLPCGQNETGWKLLEMGEFWTQGLDKRDHAFLRRAAPSIEIDSGDGRLVFFHGSPRSYNEPVLSSTPSEEIHHMFAGIEAPLVFVGHTHVQMVRRLPFTLLVNPGSVGLSFLEWPVTSARVLPWAEFAIVDYDGPGSVDIQLRRVPYDARLLVDQVLASGVPHAKWWTDCFILDDAVPYDVAT